MTTANGFMFLDELNEAIAPQLACRPDELEVFVERLIEGDQVEILETETGRICRFSSLPENRRAVAYRDDDSTNGNFDVFRCGNGWSDLELSSRPVVCGPRENRSWGRFIKSATSQENGGHALYKVRATQIEAWLKQRGLSVSFPIATTTESAVGDNPRRAGAKQFSHRDDCTDALFLKLIGDGDDEQTSDAAYDDFIVKWYQDRGKKPPERTTMRKITKEARDRWQRQDGPKALPVIRR